MSRTVSLNGDWSYQPLAHVLLKPGPIFEERTDQLPSGGTMRLPGNWQLRGLNNFHGRVRFSRSFTFDGLQQGEESLHLCFRGVDYFARVWLNDQEIGTHEGYFQPFHFDITHQVIVGENKIVVDVTCPLEEPVSVWPDKKIVIKGILNHWDCRPGSWDLTHGQDMNSGGIWNDVYLETRAAAHIEHVRVSTRLVPRNAPAGYEVGVGVLGHVTSDESESQQAIVLFDVEVSAPAGNYDLSITLGDDVAVTTPIVVRYPGERHTVSVSQAEPRLWWTWDLGEPHLETATIRLSRQGAILCEKTIETGLREIRLDTATGQWYLNGVRFFVRGTNIVPTLWLSDYDNEAIARDIALLREAHVNGVRMCVHVNREELYTALDRAGIIVWQDFPLQWGYTESPEFMQEAIRQIKDMIRLLAHHPCIALWCCQNESTFHNKHILDPVLASVVGEEDASRPIRATSEFSEHTYVGWYYGHYRDYSGLPATPILSEFGAQALPSEASLKAMVGDSWPPNWEKLAYHDFQYDQTFLVAGVEMGSSWAEFVENSQRYQARLLKFSLEAYRQAKYSRLGGLFQFMFVDCWPSITWSVVGYDRQPKLGYAVLKQCLQPVLIGLRLEREKHLIGVDKGQHARPLKIAPWVVNDRHERLSGCSFRVRISGASGVFEIASSPTFDLPADSIVERTSSAFWLPPDDLAPGVYEIALTLFDSKDEVISENQYEIEMVRREP